MLNDRQCNCFDIGAFLPSETLRTMIKFNVLLLIKE